MRLVYISETGTGHDMNNLHNTIAKPDKKSGAAIILVLGMLAILLIMAAAFSVNMRVERMGSGNYRYGVSTRHLLLAALARAVDDIDNSITNSTNSIMFPYWDILASTGSSESATLVWGDALKYIPAVLAADAKAVSCQWLPIDPDVNGRYAYVIVNVSGFLDANHVGGERRGYGATPVEIQLAALSDIADTNLFTEYRDDDVRYETLKEFGELQDGGGLVTNELPKHFVTYSRYPPGSLDGGIVDATAVSIAGDADAIISKKAEIRNAFRASGMTAGEALRAYRALVDYVDTDSIPGNENGTSAARLTSPYVEPVPMINELWCRGKFEFSTNNNAGTFSCAGRYRFQIECAYPFLYPAFPSGYKCAVTISSTNSAFEPNENPFDKEYDITMPGFWKKTIAVGDLRFDAGNIGALTPGQEFVIDLDFDAKIKNPADNAVDELGAPIKLQLAFKTPNIISNIFEIETEVGVECVDPRVNEKVSMWVPSPTNIDGTVSHSMGFMNSIVTNMVATNIILDRDIWAFVRNGEIKHVGELGHLFFGKPLETVRLYSHGSNNYHTVLDHFTLGSDSKSPRKGLVNLNSTSRDILSAVFTNMPIREDDITTVRLADHSAIDAIADGIMEKGPFTNLSDIALVDWVTHAAGMAATISNPPMCDIDIESYIRNSAGMFGTRQQLFVIILAAGPFRMMPGIAAFKGDWLGRSRAVALVWRDPFPDANGRHPCFVRLFKTLTDE